MCQTWDQQSTFISESVCSYAAKHFKTCSADESQPKSTGVKKRKRKIWENSKPTNIWGMQIFMVITADLNSVMIAKLETLQGLKIGTLCE